MNSISFDIHVRTEYIFFKSSCNITVIINHVTFPSQMFKRKHSHNSNFVLNGNFTTKIMLLQKEGSQLPYHSEISQFHTTDHETALSHQPALLCCCQVCTALSCLSQQYSVFSFTVELLCLKVQCGGFKGIYWWKWNII